MIQLIGPALAGARAIGGIANIGRYAVGTGATLAGILGASSANAGRRQTIQERPVVNPEFLRPDYSGAGERARRFQEYSTGNDIPGANTNYSARLKTSASAPSSPAERAYQQEASRVAQLAAQNPELQRYETARQAAVAKDATPEAVQKAEDIGMQIWAQRHGKLAEKVKPGQAGYDVIQGVLNAGTMGQPIDLPFNPESPLGSNAMYPVPGYGGVSALQPVGQPLPKTQFGTPANQAQAQMFNRFMSAEPQIPLAIAPINPQEATATYASAQGITPLDGMGALTEGQSFATPAAKRRAELFASLLSQANAR